MLWHLRNLLTHCKQIHYEVDKYLCEVVDQFVHIKKTCMLPFSGSALSLQNSMHVQLANRFVCMCFSCLNLQLHRTYFGRKGYTLHETRDAPSMQCCQGPFVTKHHHVTPLTLIVPLFPLFKLLFSIRPY